jgi:hypothetical protein
MVSALHDGYRLMARRDPIGIRLLTRNGYDWPPRYPLIVEAANRLKVRSCLIDGEAVICDDNGLAVFERLRRPGRIDDASVLRWSCLRLLIRCLTAAAVVVAAAGPSGCCGRRSLS